MIWKQCRLIRFFWTAVLSLLLLFCACSGLDKRHQAIFDDVWETVKFRFYDPAFNGMDWGSLYSKYKPIVRKCPTDESLLAVINQMLFELDVSHIGIGRVEQVNDFSSPYMWLNGTIGVDVRLIDGEAVVVTVSSNSSAVEAGIKPGQIIKAINGKTVAQIMNDTVISPPDNPRNRRYRQTEEILRHLYGEGSSAIEIEYLDGDNNRNKTIVDRRARHGGVKLFPNLPPVYLENEARLIEVDTGYIRFNAFQPSEADMTISLLDKFRLSEKLVIDLRGNNGGSSEALKKLASRLLKSEQIVYKLNVRQGTFDFLLTRNEDYYRGRLVVLVDELSVSSAEILSDLLQYSNSATIVGNRTPGNVLSGEMFSMFDDLVLVLPVAEWVRADGQKLENYGVIPDHEVPLTRANLLRGVDGQLHFALKLLGSD